MTQAPPPASGENAMNLDFFSLETVILQNARAFPRIADIQVRCAAIADENNQ
jgi:hypothetical protein